MATPTVHRAHPRVLLVSDNRDNPNWGSRSSTMALLELLDDAGLAPRARVMDGEVRGYVALSPLAAVDGLLRRPFLARLAGAGLARGGRTRWVLERGLRLTDAVGDDPVETVARWRRSRREPMAGWIRAVRAAELVVVNGEGSMIFTTPSRLEQRFHLAMMRLALEEGVPFAYVNALVSDPAHGPRNADTYASTAALLPHACSVTTRDPRSLEVVRAMADIPAAHVPDAVFAWHGRLGGADGGAALARPEYLAPLHPRPWALGTWDFSRPYVCVGGSSEAAKDPARARSSYRPLLTALRALGYPLVVTASCSGDAFLEELAEELELPLVPPATNVMAAAQILARAELVVTGRYHPAILAGLGGTPCVLLGADSHKTLSVQHMLGYTHATVFPEHPGPVDVAAIVSAAEHALRSRASLSDAIARAVAQRAAEARTLPRILLAALGDVGATRATLPPRAPERGAVR